MNKSNLRKVVLLGEAYITAICRPDPDGNNEVQHVESAEMSFSDISDLQYDRGRYIQIDLSDFKNSVGLTVAQAIAERYEALEYLIGKQDERDRKDAEEAAVP